MLKNSFKPLSVKEIKSNLNLDFKIDILKGIENLKIQDGKIKKYYISEILEIDELKNLSNMIGKTSQKKMF